MGAVSRYIALDLGAESGRAILGEFDGRRLRLEPVHRFPNGPVRLLDSIYWDVLRLFEEIKAGLRRCVQDHGGEWAGIGLDTWGVDFGLLDRNGDLLGNPYHYRDQRTEGIFEEAFRRVPREEIFERTGIQFMPLNTLFQLLAMALKRSPILDVAQTLLTMPDLFNYWLTGRKVCEFTIATTTQCYDPRTGDWARGMMESMSIPTHFFPEVVMPGTVLGDLLPSVADEIGAGEIPVIAPACHDTGSAVVAVPAAGNDHLYISSGTWSLVGVELTQPLISNRVLELNVTNEGGAAGTFRFLKNIMGLWLLQECRRTWSREGQQLSYDELGELATRAKSFAALVNPDDASFLPHGDMPKRLAEFCRKTGQSLPEDKGAVVRCALDSLALRYRWVLERVEELLGRRLSPIHVMGGGSQNRLLCQLTANVTQRPVVAGPIEATAMGNVLVQAMARGELSSLAQARQVVGDSTELITYEPKPGGQEQCAAAYARFENLLAQA